MASKATPRRTHPIQTAGIAAQKRAGGLNPPLIRFPQTDRASHSSPHADQPRGRNDPNPSSRSLQKRPIPNRRVKPTRNSQAPSTSIGIADSDGHASNPPPYRALKRSRRHEDVSAEEEAGTEADTEDEQPRRSKRLCKNLNRGGHGGPGKVVYRPVVKQTS